MTSSTPKNADDQLEEIVGINSILRITWAIVRHPLAFALYREADALKEARLYAVRVVLVFLALGPLLGWLSGQTGTSKAVSVNASTQGASAYLDAKFDPDIFGIERESLIVLGVLALGAVSAAMHYVLSRVGIREVPRRMATALCLYLAGFVLFGLTAIEIIAFAVAGLQPHFTQQGLVLVITLFALVPMLWFVCLAMLIFCEWPRRLYEIRALYYYPVLAIIAAVAKAGLKAVGVEFD